MLSGPKSWLRSPRRSSIEMAAWPLLERTPKPRERKMPSEEGWSCPWGMLEESGRARVQERQALAVDLVQESQIEALERLLALLCEACSGSSLEAVGKLQEFVREVVEREMPIIRDSDTRLWLAEVI